MKTRLLALAGLALLLWSRYAQRRARATTGTPGTSPAREHELDDELDATFPASDPPSMTQPPTITRRKPRR